jgi:hypothetical protein
MPAINGVPLSLSPAAGSSTASAVTLVGDGPVETPIVQANGVSTASSLAAVLLAPVSPVSPAAGVSTTYSMFLGDLTEPLRIFRGQSRQVLDNAAAGESSRVVLSSGSARVGGKRHGMEVQIQRGSGAGDIVVEVEGRPDRNANWAVLYSLSCLAAASQAVVEEVPYMAEIRLRVSSAAAATVDGWVIA